jgi:hypothetical protein
VSREPAKSYSQGGPTRDRGTQSGHVIGRVVRDESADCAANERADEVGRPIHPVHFQATRHRIQVLFRGHRSRRVDLRWIDLEHSLELVAKPGSSPGVALRQRLTRDKHGFRIDPC